MEQAMFPQNENNTPFDNEALFDAEGHLTDEIGRASCRERV